MEFKLPLTSQSARPQTMRTDRSSSTIADARSARMKSHPHSSMSRKKKNNIKSRKSGATKKPRPAQTAPPPTAEVQAKAVAAAVLDEQKLQHLYSSMLKCQMLCRIAQESSAPQPVVAGREAVLAGALAHSRRDDYVASAQNAVLTNLLRGDEPALVLAQLFSHHGGENEQPQPTSGQLALIKAMGAARDLQGSARVALAFCGADPAALSFQKEALALAAKHKAPVVCLIETTISAIDAEIQPGKKRKRPEPEFPAIVVDGSDVVAIFRVMQEAVRRARHGQGPSLIECVMPGEGAADPLGFMEQYLRRKNLWSDEWHRRIADEFAAQLDRALPLVPGPAVR